MKDYYNLFINLSLQQCTESDYADKQKVEVHNKATKKLKQLQYELMKIDCTEILSMLLSYEDDRVKLNAASFCLQVNVLVDKAVLILKNIVDFSKDSTMRFSAKMLLQNIS